MNACERCVYGSGEHMEGCTSLVATVAAIVKSKLEEGSRQLQRDYGPLFHGKVIHFRDLPPRFPARLGR